MSDSSNLNPGPAVEGAAASAVNEDNQRGPGGGGQVNQDLELDFFDLDSVTSANYEEVRFKLENIFTEKGHQKGAMLNWLAQLLEEEGALEQTVEELKKSMGKVSHEVREKEEDVRKLTKKLEKLTGAWIRNLDRPGSNSEGPGPTDTEKVPGEERAAVDILPEEVWKLILGQLSESKDLWNLCNTCQLFEDLLRPWKTGWMLEQALPHLYRHLPGSKLLECRQVSKGWNAGVNRFLEDHPSIQPHRAESDPRGNDFVYPVKEKGIGNRNVFTFGPGEDLSILEKLFPRKLQRNPFIGRYVTFHLRKPNGLEDTLEVEEQRWAKMYDLLEGYGKEIWSLALYFPLQPGAQIREKICELLTSKLFRLAPNLRKLVMNETGFTVVTAPIIDPEELPPAPNLRTLQVHLKEDANADDPIVDALIRKYHWQLEELHLSELTWQLVCFFDWRDLKDLSLYVGPYDDDLRRLYGRDLTSPHLSKLTLNLEDMTRLNFASLAEVVNELALRSSLSSIRLIGPFQDIQFAKLETPLYVSEAVKTLELVDPWNGNSTALPSHNFLRCFPLVENLIIFVRKIPSEESPSPEGNYKTEMDMMPEEECKMRAAGLRREDEVVEVNKYDGQMYKSNIWELLPRLKVLRIQWDIYTREEYEAYSRNRPGTASLEAVAGAEELAVRSDLLAVGQDKEDMPN